MPRDSFTMSENSGSFGMQQRQDRFDAIGDLIVGPPGPPGPQGPPGEDGKSAYQSAVDGGYQGTEAEFNDELSDIRYAASLARDAADDAEAAAEHYPKIQNGTWWVWDVERELFVDTGISAQGPKGDSVSLTILSYGHSTWSDFIAAYNSRSIVYCRASSGSDPASGSQTRLAFMAYVNSAASPTSVEFQYYRSVSSHSDAQQGDQVFIYKLTSGGVWSVTVREAYTKIVAGENMTSSYANGTLTLNATGGGGGTSDYDDLTDKPSINNVTLSGNKTAAELGLGTYSKPSSGIPQTDLASAVQSKLDNTVVVSDTQPTATENKLWVDTDAGAGTSYQIPTVAEMDAADNTILGNLAMIESSPATTAHAVGDYIVYNGQLYKVTAAIAAGQTLTVGTNIAATTIAGAFGTVSEASPTVGTNITNIGTFVRKVGKVVVFSGIARATADLAGNGTTVFTIPIEYAPSIGVTAACYATYNNTAGMYNFFLQTDGVFRTNIGFGIVNANTAIYINFTYFTK